MRIMLPEEFAACEHVSRETMVRLERYVDELRKWQSKINLVGPRTLDDVWRRHIQDSAQLAPYIPSGSRIIDLGSGAGFPGLVLAIMGLGEVVLVESDQRKAAFMREVIRITEANATVLAQRIENIGERQADFITSRALSSLDQLLEFAEPFLKTGGVCLFLKGKSWKEELTAAQKLWNMRAESTPSRTDPDGVVLKISEVRRGRTDPDDSAKS